MLVIQAAAAVLLLLGSGLIFRALMELELPAQPRRRIGRSRVEALPRFDPPQTAETPLRRAA